MPGSNGRSAPFTPIKETKPLAQIETLTAKDIAYTGTIRTITTNVKAQLVPNADKASDGAPDFRLYAGGAELGAAWRKESKDGDTPYLAVKLNDPSFASPMRAAFFENETDGTDVMVWNRPRRTEHPIGPTMSLNLKDIEEGRRIAALALRHCAENYFPLLNRIEASLHRTSPTQPQEGDHP